MPPTHLAVEGLGKFLALVGEHSEKRIVALFCGGVGDNGESWCPDCVKAEPVIEKAVNETPADVIFINCSVGGRSTWKDQQNEFRVHEKLRLTGVPTLLEWNTPKRLVEEDCANENLVKMFFEED